MSNNIIFNRRHIIFYRIIFPPNTIIMFTEVITQMNSWYTSDRFMKYLNNIWITNLMNNSIELITLSQSIHFDLTSPSTIFRHSFTVVFKCIFFIFRLIININIWSELISILFNIINCCFPICFVITLRAF
jgi:hypothetical protein